MRERQAYERDPQEYLRCRLRREIVRAAAERRMEFGYSPPLTSRDVDRARRRIAESIGIELRDVPAAIGWPLWPERASAGDWHAPDASSTMPAPYEWVPHDAEPAWPGLYMRALEKELAPLRAADPEFDLDRVENPWQTIPHALYRAALRARAAMRSLAVHKAVAA